ncbi:cell cycle regulated microtubule associated protein [Actinidia rufa]|uniref:Cell cycle regulated microtubule associated protein n=1 Tax=Actinidia rufa TaxID=165716 RepID=A0A7J0FRM5_9ERIC|nr:cell cycle regulated microtubule associated protein [Actinidia rufa]
MDEEMEDSMELTFTAVEVDLDYEFDASRHFDFTSEESIAEAREAELWFESAGSYPPSPFVTKLVLHEDFMQETVNTSPKSNNLVNTALPDSDTDNGVDQYFSIMEMSHRDCIVENGGIFAKLNDCTGQKFHNQPPKLPTGLTFYNPMTTVNSFAKSKSIIKPSFPRTSTLMKPTASQLAKQNQPRKVGDLRVQKLLVESNEKSLGIECQAAKRQKLGGGLLRKVDDAKQQTNLVHKAPKKDGTTDGNSAHAKLKLTIPKEPDFETTHRAQRTRPKITSEPGTAAATVRRFKAFPLNKKILEAPSLLLPKRSIPRLPEFQEFNLKTSERALQHTKAVSSSLVSCSNTDKVLHKPSTDAIAETANGEPKRSYFVDAPKHKGCEFVHNFKARPLNKKIFSSKGDIGVFRNKKKETTIPMEFNLQTEKRSQHNPPVDLFNKGSKENRPSSFRQEHEIKHTVKEKRSMFWEKQPQCGNDGGITEVGSLPGMNRMLPIICIHVYLEICCPSTKCNVYVEHVVSTEHRTLSVPVILATECVVGGCERVVVELQLPSVGQGEGVPRRRQVW